MNAKILPTLSDSLKQKLHRVEGSKTTLSLPGVKLKVQAAPVLILTCNTIVSKVKCVIKKVMQPSSSSSSVFYHSKVLKVFLCKKKNHPNSLLFDLIR